MAWHCDGFMVRNDNSDYSKMERNMSVIDKAIDINGRDAERASRRRLLKIGAVTMIGVNLPLAEFAAADDAEIDRYTLRYICASAMYGTMKLSEILPEVRKAGADTIDLWPKPHGDQHEQVLAMGVDRFAEMLAEHEVGLGGIACYKFGAFNLKIQMELAKAVGGKEVALVCMGKGPRDAKGDELKKAVATFVEQLKPHYDEAIKHGCLIAIENHSNNMINSPDSMKWFGEMTAKMPGLGIAFAPHHLPQDAEMQAKLIEDLGDAINFFYAQQYGKGSKKKLPKEEELLQMPGRGPLDFCPLLRALKKINYTGRTEIFMHPVPRGVPILDTAEAITAEINQSRTYLETCLQKEN